LGAAGVIVICALLLATIYLRSEDTHWVAFLGGVLMAASLALASRSAHASWIIARRNAQVAALRGRLGEETRTRAAAQAAASRLDGALRQLDEHLPAMVSFIDPERRVRYHNRAYAAALGRPGESLEGKPVSEILGEAAWAEVTRRLDEAFTGIVVRFERSQRMADGHVWRLAAQYLPRFGDGGKIIGVFAILTDITERRDVASPRGRYTPQEAYANAMAAELTPWEDFPDRLRRAFRDGEFTLYSQRIAALAGADRDAPFREILVRLREEEENLMPPGAFLPLAEEHGMMPELDAWVVGHLLAWVRAEPEARGGIYSINLAGSTIEDERFVEAVREALGASGSRAPRVCFELTEVDARRDIDRTAEFMRALRRAGCAFALSGFGRDPVSFKILKELHFDYVKLDAGIVLAAGRDDVGAAKVRAINQVAHQLGVRTIAECVESPAAMAALRSDGVDFAQGFAVSTPRPLGDDDEAAVVVAIEPARRTGT
jgi:PAS domain S-box-containing protein